jgi:hypothetical protein
MAEVALDVEMGGLVRTLKDLLAGAAGGVAQVLIGAVFRFSSLTSLCFGFSLTVTCFSYSALLCFYSS